MMRYLLKKAVGFYRFILSPIFFSLGARCRFHPSCSEYAERALETRPLTQAVRLILWRLMRCGPWSAGGIDHVPQVGR